MLKLQFTFIALISASILLAQNNDSILKATYRKKIKGEFPKTRMFNLEYNLQGPTAFTSKLFDENFSKGTIDSQREVNFISNIPLYKNKKWTYTGSLNYRFNEFVFSDVENVSSSTNYTSNKYEQFHTFAIVLSTTYTSKLFNKPFIYNGSLILDGGEQGFERIKGIIGASIVLKATKNKVFSIGTLVFIDPTAIMPILPIISYNQKFENSNYELDIFLPQRLFFRKNISHFARLSLGSRLAPSGFYVYNDGRNILLPNTSEYAQIEVQSGLTYEHLLNKKCIITISGGVSSFITSRLTEKAQPIREYYYSNQQEAKGFFNIGLSYNPDLRKKK